MDDVRRRDVDCHRHADRQMQFVGYGIFEAGVAELPRELMTDRFDRHAVRRGGFCGVVLRYQHVAEHPEHEHQGRGDGCPPEFERRMIVDRRSDLVYGLSLAIAVANREVQHVAIDVHKDRHAEERHEFEEPVDLHRDARRFG